MRDSASSAVGGIVGGIVSGLVVACTFYYLSPSLAERVRQPTCLDPLPLSLVDTRDAEVTASATAITPDGVAQTEWDLDNATDGSSQTGWVPELQAEPTRGFIRLEFPESIDVQLVCVVNGLASSESTYRGAGKLRMVAVLTAADASGAVRTVLRVLGSDNMQERQELRVPAGATDFLQIDILSAFQGERVFNPETGSYDEISPNIALSEVELYTNGG